MIRVLLIYEAMKRKPIDNKNEAIRRNKKPGKHVKQPFLYFALRSFATNASLRYSSQESPVKLPRFPS